MHMQTVGWLIIGRRNLPILTISPSFDTYVGWNVGSE